MSQKKYLDSTGVAYLWNKAKGIYVRKEQGKTLSDNNYTTVEKQKLASLENYQLPAASNNQLGGIKVGQGLAIDANGVVSVVGAAPASEITFSSITGLPSTLEGYGITDGATKQDLRSTYIRKGSLNAVSDLSAVENPEYGWVYNILENGRNYAWTEGVNEGPDFWDDLGGNVIVDALTTAELDEILL